MLIKKGWVVQEQEIPKCQWLNTIKFSVFCSRIQTKWFPPASNLLWVTGLFWSLFKGGWCFPLTHPECGLCHSCSHFVGQLVTQLPTCKAVEKYNFSGALKGRRIGDHYDAAISLTRFKSSLGILYFLVSPIMF